MFSAVPAKDSTSSWPRSPAGADQPSSKSGRSTGPLTRRSAVLAGGGGGGGWSLKAGRCGTLFPPGPNSAGPGHLPSSPPTASPWTSPATTTVQFSGR
jgi:hypothetical protein